MMVDVMDITIKESKPSGKELLVNGRHAGTVFQNPDSPDVENPGKWGATIVTSDRGLWALGFFDTEKIVLEAAVGALELNLTFAEWQARS